MSATQTLSPQQRSALESSYVFLSSVIPFLAGIDSRVEADEKLVARSLRELGYVCQQKLLEAFPQLLSWVVEEWTQRGGGQ